MVQRLTVSVAVVLLGGIGIGSGRALFAQTITPVKSLADRIAANEALLKAHAEFADRMDQRVAKMEKMLQEARTRAQKQHDQGISQVNKAKAMGDVGAAIDSPIPAPPSQGIEVVQNG